MLSATYYELFFRLKGDIRWIKFDEVYSLKNARTETKDIVERLPSVETRILRLISREIK